jgi:hypothetical protein
MLLQKKHQQRQSLGLLIRLLAAGTKVKHTKKLPLKEWQL